MTVHRDPDGPCCVTSHPDAREVQCKEREQDVKDRKGDLYDRIYEKIAELHSRVLGTGMDQPAPHTQRMSRRA